MDAYREFSKGLIEHDKGNTAEMTAHMKRALTYDPDYEKPKEYIYYVVLSTGEKVYLPGKSEFQTRLTSGLIAGLLLGGVTVLADNMMGKELGAGPSFGIGFGFGFIYYLVVDVKKEEKK